MIPDLSVLLGLPNAQPQMIPPQQQGPPAPVVPPGTGQGAPQAAQQPGILQRIGSQFGNILQNPQFQQALMQMAMMRSQGNYGGYAGMAMQQAQQQQRENEMRQQQMQQQQVYQQGQLDQQQAQTDIQKQHYDTLAAQQKAREEKAVADAEADKQKEAQRRYEMAIADMQRHIDNGVKPENVENIARAVSRNRQITPEQMKSLIDSSKEIVAGGAAKLEKGPSSWEEFTRVRAERPGLTYDKFLNEDANRRRTIINLPPKVDTSTYSMPEPGKRNEAFLTKFTPEQQMRLKQLVDYKMSPTALSARADVRATWLAYAGMYDPDYNPSRYEIRQGMIKNATAGGPNSDKGKGVSLNTAIHHLSKLDELTKALNNGDVQAQNEFVNWVKTELGYSEVPNVELAIAAVADELGAAFKASGATDISIEGFKKPLITKRSPGAWEGAIDTAVGLLGGRVKAIEAPYEKEFGKPWGFIDPDSKEILTRMGYNPETMVRVGGKKTTGKIVQHSPSTGQYRHSLDGGKTWLPGQ